MALKKQSQSLPPEHVGSFAAQRPPFSATERMAVEIAGVATTGFCIYGIVTGTRSTMGYVLSVLVAGAAALWLRQTVVPGPLALGLALAAILNLAGGLIKVGQNVLYNASIGPYSRSLGTHYLQYDHVVHAFVCFVLTFACWIMLAVPHQATHHGRDLVILTVGLAVGLGALNEVVEFAATLAHHGAHVGGYFNTGWDLVCNLLGAGAAGLIIARSVRVARLDPAGAPG